MMVACRELAAARLPSPARPGSTPFDQRVTSSGEVGREQWRSGKVIHGGE